MTAVSASIQSISPFAQIPAAPPDPIIGLTEAFNSDSNPRKVNLGVGVYQDKTGKVPLLKSVHEAEMRLLAKAASKSYLPIDGDVGYNRLVQALLFGEGSPLIEAGCAVTAQAPGGTGALKIGADFLHRFFPDAGIWISDPSWENHQALFTAAGFDVNRYRYYDPQTHGLDFDGMLRDLQQLPQGSIVVLHACCHNPTGVDLNREQWGAVIDLLCTRNLIPFLDFAYQGFGDGLEPDSFAVRAFAEGGRPFLVANSFSKSFSLYRERVGALTLVTTDAAEAKQLQSQLKRTIRTNYSSPPAHGAQVVATILADSQLRDQWEAELAAMRERIRHMRTLFVDTLHSKKLNQDFSFIAQQKGMFSYSGLSTETVRRLRAEYGLYIVDSGRICVAAMNEGNLGYISEAITAVLEK